MSSEAATRIRDSGCLARLDRPAGVFHRREFDIVDGMCGRSRNNIEMFSLSAGTCR
jgi:hypothetical protein